MNNAEGTDWDEEFRNGGTLLHELPEPDGIAVLRPGDRLVLRYQRHVNAAEAAQIKAACSERLPGVDAVIVSACDGWMIHREEPS